MRFAHELIGAARGIRPDLTVTAAMMPDGATSLTDTSFGDLHYGQRFRDASTLFDYILPMAYRRAYEKDEKWIAEVVRNAVNVGNRVLCGLQAYEDGISSELQTDVDALLALAESGAFAADRLLGIVLFRHGDYHYARIVQDGEKAEIKVLQSIPEKPFRRRELTLADGLTITEASLAEAFCEASRIVSSDGRSVTLEGNPLLDSDQEGRISVAWTGHVPAGVHPLQLRVWSEKESRIFHVFA